MQTTDSAASPTTGVLHRVKVLGPTSKNGRRYLPAAVRAAAPLYEGVPVNLNHLRAPGSPRAVTERFGVLRRTRFEAGALWADLHYLTRHPLAPMIAEAAARMPAAVGLSHTAEGKTRREGDVDVVYEITRVHSVDLVADPAATRGLFEARASAYERRLSAQSLAEHVSRDQRV